MYNSKTIISMKKILLSISAVTAMIAMTATFCACSSDDEQQEVTYGTLILDADKSNYIDVDENGTRALELTQNENAIKTYWYTSDGKSDIVTVFANNWQTQLGQIKPKSNTSTASQPAKTKLTGSITYNNLKAGDVLNLIYPRPIWQYTDQKGTITDISDNFDYITTNVNVVYIDATNTDNPVYATTASFGKAQQTIVRFTLLAPDGTTALSVPELSITTAGNQLVKKCSLDGTATDKGGALVITPAAATNVFYVAIRNNVEGADEYTLTAKVGDNVYTYTKSNLNLVRGNYKKVKVTMKYYDDTYTEREAYYNEDGEEVWN